MKKFKLKKGDKVVVIAGADKGKVGEILKLLPAEDRVIVSGVKKAKKHTKPTSAEGGGIVEKCMPMHISNVAFYDEKSGKPSRVGFKLLADDTKKRFAKVSGEIIG